MIWYICLKDVFIHFLKYFQESYEEVLHFSLSICPTRGYGYNEVSSDDDSINSDNEKGLDIVSEEKEEEDKTHRHKEDKPAKDKKPYISVSQFLINGVLQRSVDNVTNKSFLDEWIIVDKNIETNPNKKIN